MQDLNLILQRTRLQLINGENLERFAAQVIEELEMKASPYVPGCSWLAGGC